MKKILISVILVSFFVASFDFVFLKKKPLSHASPEVTPQPVLLDKGPLLNRFIDKPELSATSVYIEDLESGKVLYEKNADLLVPPASTTKVVTALTAIDSQKMDSIVKVPFFSSSIQGQKMHLVYGEKISFESLLYGLLIFSGNDAAEAVAQTYIGGRSAFIDAMNTKIKSLGLKVSVFKNPTGLDEAGQLTTAREMSLLGKHLLSDSRLKSIVGTKQAVVYSSNLKMVHKLQSTNELLGVVAGVSGIKTGWTEEARENLITYIDRGHPIIISLFGSDDRFGETKSLIDWIYKSYEWR